MELEILTPEKKIFSGKVYSVQVPGESGKFQMLDKHAPIVSSIKKVSQFLQKYMSSCAYKI